MPSLVTTPGASTANSYNSASEMDAYAEGTEWSADWAAITDDDQKAVFGMRATRAIDTIAFPGYPSTDDQSLQFPRTDVPNARGGYYATDTIPAIIKRAHAHVAAWLASLEDDADPFSLDDTAKLESLEVGPVSLVFRQGVSADGARFLSTIIAPMLSPWGILSPVGSVRLVR